MNYTVEQKMRVIRLYLDKGIIEYPPKVSVKVISKDDEFFATDKEAGGYTITNQIDAIIETKEKEGW